MSQSVHSRRRLPPAAQAGPSSLPPPAIAAAPAAASPPAEDDSLPILQLEDVFGLELATDPQISPDGSRVVYVRNSMDILVDRQRSRLWIVGADGSDHRALTSGESGGDERSPRWSPDGNRIAYVSSGTLPDDRSAQIHVRWMDSGQTARLTQLPRPPANLSWSPDGRLLAFSMLVPEPSAPYVQLPAKPENADWAPAARVIRKMIYRADGVGYLEDGYSQIFVVPAEGGSPRQLTTGPFHHRSRLSWTPEGAHIVFSANRRRRRTEGTRGQRDPPGGARRRRNPHPDLAARSGREPGGLAGWRADCLSGLRRPLPGVPGHQALRDEPRRLVADRGDRFARPGRRPAAVERGQRRPLLPVRRRGGHQGGVRASRRRGRGAVFRPGRHLPRPSLRGRFLLGGRKRVVRLHVGNDRAPRRRLDRAGRRAGHRAQRGPARAPGDRRDEGDLARVLVRRTSDPGLGGDAARIRSLPEVPADPRDPRRPVHQLRVPVHRRGAAVRRRGLRRALREPARQHLLWRGVREPDPPRLSQPGLRRPDERGGRGDRRGLRGREQPLRHRRQRRRGADELDRGAHRPVRRRGGRQAGHQLVQLRADRGRLRVLLPLLVPRVPVGPPRALPRAFAAPPRGERDHPDDAAHRRGGLPHPDVRVGAVLPGAPVARDRLGAGPHSRVPPTASPPGRAT